MTEPAKNNPMGLAGVFALVVLSVLGLAQTRTPRAVEGRAFAAATRPAEPSAPPRPRAVYQLTDHPLLTSTASLEPVTCQLPRFGVSDKQLAAYYTAGMLCLNQAWKPLLSKANLPFEPPTLDASPDLRDSPCGAAPSSEKAVAYYCGRNQTIYMPTSRLRENDGGDTAATHIATLAHEYGHHVQAVSGMLRAADLKITNAGETTPAGLETSRRLELQANCFAGMFLASVAGRGSVSTKLAIEAEQDFQYAMEETPEHNAHGSPANQAEWAASGFKHNSTAACDTYAAPPERVG